MKTTKIISKNFDNLYFLGRLGDYKYYDMDKAVARAIDCFEKVFNVSLITKKEC